MFVPTSEEHFKRLKTRNYVNLGFRFEPNDIKLVDHYRDAMFDKIYRVELTVADQIESGKRREMSLRALNFKVSGLSCESLRDHVMAAEKE